MANIKSIPNGLWIETPRLVLSDFTPTDLSDFTGLFERLRTRKQEWFAADAAKPGTICKLLNRTIEDQSETPRQNFRFAVRHKEPGGIKLIGYVSLCAIHGIEIGQPDLGVMIDPHYQRNRYTREACLAQIALGFSLNHERLYCDIAAHNKPAIRNALPMGFTRDTEKDGTPCVIKTATVHGMQNWQRFELTRQTFFSRLPRLVDEMRRYWPLNDQSVHRDLEMPFRLLTPKL